MKSNSFDPRTWIHPPSPDEAGKSPSASGNPRGWGHPAWHIAAAAALLAAGAAGAWLTRADPASAETAARR
jgi:hypothetical protein